MLLSSFHVHMSLTVLSSVRASEIKFFKIGVHNPYRVDLVELNPRMFSFFLSYIKL